MLDVAVNICSFFVEARHNKTRVVIVFYQLVSSGILALYWYTSCVLSALNTILYLYSKKIMISRAPCRSLGEPNSRKVSSATETAVIQNPSSESLREVRQELMCALL